jgi:hypothetical protein
VPRTAVPLDNRAVVYTRIPDDVNAWLRSTAAREANTITTVVRRILRAAYDADQRERGGDR